MSRLELVKGELQDLKSKILISNVSDNNRKPTKVFTKYGLYMLAMVLKGQRQAATLSTNKFSYEAPYYSKYRTHKRG